jgi:pyridoxal phosphate enzyme (YggS family)
MIAERVKAILAELPKGVELEAAAKTRTAAEIEEAIAAGVKIIGENYVQEALKVKKAVKLPARWHLIGHLQKNKVKKAVQIFDMIETVDSYELAEEINKKCQKINKIMPVLVEINSGKEPQKAGVMPEEAIDLIKCIAKLPYLKVMGLMTMGPWLEDPEKLRPYFRLTKELFEEIKALNLPKVEMRYLSMGMSDSYKIAIEEGANLVRIGTKIFGERRKNNV